MCNLPAGSFDPLAEAEKLLEAKGLVYAQLHIMPRRPGSAAQCTDFSLAFVHIINRTCTSLAHTTAESL
jgi:hypothetical protein